MDIKGTRDAALANLAALNVRRQEPVDDALLLSGMSDTSHAGVARDLRRELGE